MQQSTNSRVELPNAKGEGAKYRYEAVVVIANTTWSWSEQDSRLLCLVLKHSQMND